MHKDNTDRVRRLEDFRELLVLWNGGERTPQLRSQINREAPWARQQVIEAKCYRSLTIGPPPAVGGLVMQGVDAFEMMFNPPYLMNLTSVVIDMIDCAIGVISAGPQPTVERTPTLTVDLVPNYAFVAMPMDPTRPEFEDVLDAIKEACNRCGIQAERIDDPQSNERITDRILESIQRAEFVIADLTESKPNVYFEAGYAHALGKTPIYLARQDTLIEFDLKDYPVIFFDSLKKLKADLEKRLRGISKERAG